MERRDYPLTLGPNTAAMFCHLTTSLIAILTVKVGASVPREECWTRLRLAMAIATMITRPQNRMDMIHSSAAGISVCQCGECAEATLDVKTVLMLRSVMRISLVSHGGGYRREANFRLF